MTRFVLVHGSGQNATCWDRVAGVLRGRGYAVAAPDLPKEAAGWTLADHAHRIAESVEGPDDTVVAHSLSGIFLPLVPAKRRPGRLVYLAAVIPEQGKSVRDQFGEDATMFDPAWIAAGERWFDEAQREALGREFLFHDCEEADLPAALRTLEPFDTRALVVEPSPAAAAASVPAAAIVATEDRTLAPDWIDRAARRLLKVEPFEIRAGHCPQQSRPGELADLLERIATRQAS